MKKAFAILLAIAMLLSLAVPAMAEEKTYELTVENATTGHIYEAYQIFTGELAEIDGKQILSDIEWGVSINPEKIADLLAAIDAEAELSALHGQTTAAGLAEKLSTLTDDSVSLDTFAQIVGETYIYTDPETQEESIRFTYLADRAGVSTETDGVYTISGLHAGYYLVKDQEESLDGDYDAYTKYIIRVVKDVSVKPKSSVPSVDKTINDTIDGTFTNIEDFDINDTVYYKWTGTLPSNLASYEEYTYTFLDTLPTGIVHVNFEQIYIEGHDGNRVHTFYDITDASTGNDAMPTGLTQNVVGSNVTLTFANLFELYPNIQNTHKIVVKYSARVTRDALIATPMTNSVKVQYSNNPNGEGYGETPEDKAHAFTFQINVDKYDADDSSKKLANAEFVLYYERIVPNDAGEDQIVKYYAQVVTEEMIEAGEEINGTAVDADDLGVVYNWIADREQASILDTDAYGAMSVRGMDSGIFYLEETKAPAGYNLMETPVMIEIIPTYTDNGDTASVTVKYAVDAIEQSSNTVGVRNSSGSTLPSTGGMGTTIFYILGSLMAVGAAVVLVTKKRMAAEV